AGMAADLFETYAVTIVATMLLTALFFTGETQARMLLYPLLVGGVCIVTSVIGTFFVKLGSDNHIMKALYKGLAVTGALSAVVIFIVTKWYIGDIAFTVGQLSFTWMNLFWCSMTGLVVTGLLVWITEYYTGTG